jgi:hypothetical protein
MGVACGTYGGERGACGVLVGKSEGRRPLGIPGLYRMENIKMNHQEICWESVDWIDLAEERGMCWAVVNTVMNVWVP